MITLPRSLPASLVFGVIFVLLRLVAHSETSHAAKSFELAAGPANVTLKQFAEQAGREIVFMASEVAGTETTAVRGRFIPREALGLMLGKTGLVISVDPKTGAFAVRKPGEIPKEQGAGLSTVTRPDRTGTIEGRVLNADQEFLERALVAVAGTAQQTLTDSVGFFRLSDVPPGPAEIRVFYTGMPQQQRTVVVIPEETVRADFTLANSAVANKPAGDTVVLDAMEVSVSREMAGSAIAINQRRFAPNQINVVSTDEYGTIPDGSVGEFLKYVPGVNIDYTGGVANTISLDGAPAANVPVTFNGFNLATTASGDPSVRQNELLQVSINNIARVEILLSPTPESPGSALAGSVNFVPRSAFERVRPQLTYNVYASMRDKERELRKTPGPRKNDTFKIQPGFDLAYIRPVNERFGFTVSAGYGNQYTAEERATAQWRGVSAATNPTGGLPDTTPDRPYLTGYQMNDQIKFNGRSSAGLSFDYRFGAYDRVSLGITYGSFSSEWTFNSLAFQLNQVNDGFTLSSVQSRPGQSEVSQSQTVREREGYTYTPTLTYRHNGPTWRAESGLAVSSSHNTFYESDRGVFGGITLRRTNVTTAFKDIFYLRPGVITVTDATTGAAVDPYALSSYVITSAASRPVSTAIDLQRTAYTNLARTFSLLNVPFTVKAGLDVRDQVRDASGGQNTYSFVGADGRGSTTPTAAGSDDGASVILDPVLSQRTQPFGFPKVQWPSADGLWSLYQKNPGYLTANPNASYRSEVANSRRANETISSGFVRVDASGWGNRLRLVGGVRAEQTNLRAEGALADPTLNYLRDSAGNFVPRRDASGKIVTDASGQPLPSLIVPTTDALGVSKLTYLSRGYRVRKEYLRFFPSLNATFAVRENVLIKAAFYESIGRPAFSQYSGGLTLPDTEVAPSSSNRVVVNNANIKPWTARTFKARVEYYFQNGASEVSAGLFHREYKNFFGGIVFPATKAFLQTYGIESSEYLDYDVQTNYNLDGQVRSEGAEVGGRQSLTFLPPWFGTVQVRGNVSVLRFSGPAAANFANFVPKTINAMIYVKKPSYGARVGWNYTSRRRAAAVTGRGIEAGTFNWTAPRLYCDVELQYFLTRNLTLYATSRNVQDKPQDGETFGPNTPEVARFRTRSGFGSTWSLGVQGRF
jgi:TonB-dependent receptor